MIIIRSRRSMHRSRTDELMRADEKLFDRNAVVVIPEAKRARMESAIGKRETGATNQSRTIGRALLSDW